MFVFHCLAYFEPAIPLLGLYPKNPETPIQENQWTPLFIVTQFTTAKQPKCPPVNKWIKKLWYIYTMEYRAAERKKELLPFTTAWMELENIMLSDHQRCFKIPTLVLPPKYGILNTLSRSSFIFLKTLFIYF